MPGGFHQTRRAAPDGAHEAGEELADQGAPHDIAGLGTHHLLAVAQNGQDIALGIETGFQLGQLLVLGQHQEVLLGQPPGGGRVELGRAMGEGKAAVMGQGVAGGELHRFEGGGGKSFHRIAVDALESRHQWSLAVIAPGPLRSATCVAAGE